MVPSCPRCGNEEDLWEWLDGRVYCVPCLTCPHGNGGTTAVCLSCVRDLFTLVTFEGPRIVDVDYYVQMAWEEYGVPTEDLMVWTFAEEGWLGERTSTRNRRVFGVIQPPPHHRLG